ncbi:MAG TPA: hypothetical protein VI172_05810 [Candidatus Dormibacteraeota bacterium]
MTTALPPVADWYVNQLAEHGLTVFLGVQAVIVVALWCTTGLAFHAIEERRARRDEQARTQYGIRIAENYANNPAVRAAWEHEPAPKENGHA